MNRFVLVAAGIILLIVVALVAAWGVLLRQPSQLAVDLSGTTPQFVNDTDMENNSISLPPDLEKIKNDVRALLIGPGPYDPSAGADIVLDAVGKRYVVITETHPTDAGSLPQILDSRTLKSNVIDGLFQFVVGNTAVYVSATDICTYTLDQSSCVPLPGAKLSGNEMYGDDEGMAGMFVPQDETHSTTSMTIAVLELVDPYTDNAHFQKVRDATYSLLQN